MDDSTNSTAPADGETTTRSRWIGWGRPAAMGAAGLLAGGLLAGTLTASAQDSGGDEGSDGTTSTAPSTPGDTDPSQPQRSDEELLTGDTADQVEEAALEEYPDATIVRIETDSDGVYEAHLTTAEGEPVTVELDEDFNVTGTEAHGGHGGRGGPHGPGDQPTDDESGTAEGSSTGLST